MKYSFFIYFVFLFCLSANSQKRLVDFLKTAREENLGCFVVYNNGDTIKGQNLKIKDNPFNDNEKWYMDGKIISNDHVEAWQDKDSYHEGMYTRVVKGKLKLFSHTIDYPRFSISSYYMKIESDGKFRIVTYNLLVENTKDCELALQQIEKEYDNTEVKKKPDQASPSLRDIARILNIYNSCNK